MKTTFRIIAAATALLAVCSCNKNDTVTTTTPVTPVIAPAKGEYVLSEGTFNGNDTKLAWYDNSSNTAFGDFFLQQNPTMTAGLGDTGNDMFVYGSKLYIVMNVSQNVTVLRASDGVFIKQIPFTGATKQPRSILGTRGNIYVTAFDNTVNVIDTTALAIVKTINVGADPEGMAASGDYLFVANSGGLNTVPDSTVSVIDLHSQTEIRKIKVGVNPYKVVVNTAGKIFVSAYGNYSTIPESVSMITDNSATVSTDLGAAFAYSDLEINGDIIYLYNNFGGTGTAKVYNSNTGTVVRNEFVTDGTVIQTPYSINADAASGDVYITDAKNFTTAGSVTCFSSDGVKKFSFSVAPGVNPDKVVFKR